MGDKEKLLNCKTFSEAAKILFGINYTNGKVKSNVVKTCFDKFNIDIAQIIFENKRKFCKNCGKEIFGNKKFCSQSCAASYNNKIRGKRSEEAKNKISKSLVATNSRKKHPSGKRDPKLKKYLYPHICESCGKKFFNGKKNQRFCSPKCAQSSESVKKVLRDKALERVKNGTHSGWKTRNIASYAERFWETVLTENKIPYTREDFSTKKYFLDFLLEKNGKKIDLEIDGKQHGYADREKHDKERDKYLANSGFVVYRVKWNSINTEEGKREMEDKINGFLKFMNTV